MLFKHENRMHFLLSLFLLSLCTACSTISPYVDRKSDISFEKARTIQLNITTRETILNEYGEPYIRGLKNGSELFIYVGSRDGQNSSLEIRFNEKNIVTDSIFYEENPRKSPK